MVNALNGIRQVTSDLCEIAVVETAREIKTGFLTIFSADGTYMLREIYSMDGFEKWTKALLSGLEFVVLFPAVKSIFAKFKDTIEWQKDLYYASLTFGVFEWCIERDDQGNAVGFQLPRKPRANGEGILSDCSSFALCIAAILETAQFFKKYKVMEFAFYTKHIEPLGQIPLAGRNLNEIPVVQSLFDGKPKEFFTVVHAIFDFAIATMKTKELWNERAHRNNDWKMKKWIVLFEFVGSLGKIIGVACYRKFGGCYWLAFVGVIGTQAPLAKFVLSHHWKRLQRNELPEAPAV
jgi:hypothetical protein